MIRTHLTYPQFYRMCRQSKYSVIITLVARYADVPQYYDELINSWSSFHDVTGDFVGFVFADIESKPDDFSYSIAWREDFEEYQAPPELKIGKSQNDSFSDYLDSWEMGVKINSKAPESWEFRDSHSGRIRELIKTLGLREADIPCLHFFFTQTGTARYIPLSHINNSLYSYIKRIMESWEPSIQAGIENRHRNFLALERINVIRSRKGALKKRINDIGQRINTSFVQSNEKGINEILASIHMMPSNPHARHEVLTQIRELRKKLPGKENQSLFNDLGTLMDIVPLFEKMLYPEHVELVYNLDEMLIESLTSQPNIFPASKSQDRWDVFIAHAGNDAELADKLYEYLCMEIKPFLDTRCLLPGDRWNEVIPKMQQGSDITVVLISSSTQQAFYAKDEIASAIKLSRQPGSTHRIIPIKLPGATDLYGLEGIHSITVNDQYDLQQAAQSIIKTHQRLF